MSATGWNGDGQCDTTWWRDITAVAAGSTHTLGLRIDGTVVAAGNNADGQCDVQEWQGIGISSVRGRSHRTAPRNLP